MREIQALDPTVDPDQAIRTPCASAAPAVPKAPAAPATPAAAQALKLTDAAARLGEALCGVPTERNPSTPHTRGCTPGWYAVPRWGTHLNYRQPYPAPLTHSVSSIRSGCLRLMNIDEQAVWKTSLSCEG